MLIELGVLAALVALAHWRGPKSQDGFLLHILVIPASAMYGFQWYETYANDTGLVFAATIIGVGAYSLWKVIESLIDWIRG